MVYKYKTIAEGGTAELVEKKSRFIAHTFAVSSEEEATAQIEKIKKQYWDARHNCWAYVIGVETPVQRCSDDGEPSQTAGKPMMDVIMGMELHNVLVIVTRYFGGTLLGTGGLVRAYSGAARAGLENSEIITQTFGVKLKIHTDYTGLGKIQYILAQNEIGVLDTVYESAVEIYAMVSMTEKEHLKAALVEGTNGQVVLEEIEEGWYIR